MTVNQRLSAGDVEVVMKGHEVFVEECESYDKNKRLAILKLEKKVLQLSRKRGEKLEQFDSKKPDSKMSGLDKNTVKALMKKVVLGMKPSGLIMRRKARVIGVDILRPFLIAIENSPHDFLAFPYKPVKVKDEWSHSLSRSDKAPSNITTTFTTQFKYQLKSIQVKDGEKLATITFKTKTIVTVKGEFDGPSFKKSEGQGQILFNITKGQMKSLNFTQEIILEEKKEQLKFDYKLKSQLLR